MGWNDIDARGRAQYGRIHVSDARAAGVTPQSLRRAGARLGFQRPHRGVLALAGTADTAEARITAALLTVEPPVLASHWTAAWLHGLVPTLPSTIHVLVPHGRRARVRDNVQVHRTRTGLPHHAGVVRGIATTSGARTLGDLAGEASTSRLRAWAIDLNHRGDASWPEILAVAEELGRVPGIGRLRRVVSETSGESPESILDYALRRRLRGSGLQPDPAAVHIGIGPGSMLVDIAWSQYKVGIDADSLTYHGDRASLQRDIRRHNRTRPSEWIVFRAGWAEVDDDDAWEELLLVVRAALRGRGAPV